MIKVLFICYGNICRSVSAQYIMQQLIDEQAENAIAVDSAATSTEEIGNEIYPPMQLVLERHGVPVGDHYARQVRKSDYDEFDLIIAMDDENMRGIERIMGGDPDGKIHYLMEYTDDPDAEIEDPWYSRDFEKAYRDIRRGCEGLFRQLEG